MVIVEIPEGYLTPKEVSELKKCPLSRVYQALYKGELAHEKGPKVSRGQAIFISKAAAEEFNPEG